MNQKSMRCFGDYKDDRLCDICKSIKYTCGFECIRETERKKNPIHLTSEEIKSQCGFYCTYDENRKSCRNHLDYPSQYKECCPSQKCIRPYYKPQY